MRPLLPMLLMLTLGVVAPTAPSQAALTSQTPGAAAGSETVLEGDPRLQKPVTLKLDRTPLARVMGDLGQLAGVSLKTSEEIAYEPAILVVRDQPVKEVMRQVTRLFHYEWRRTGNPGEFAYLLYRGEAAAREEAALRRQGPEAAFQGLRREVGLRAKWARLPRGVVQDEIAACEEGLARVARLPEARRREAEGTAGYQALKRQEALLPVLRRMTDPLDRVLIRMTDTLTPGQWQALRRGEVLAFSTDTGPGEYPLSPQRARDLRAAAPTGTLTGASDAGNGSETEPPLTQPLGDDWSEASVVTVCLRLDTETEADMALATLRIRPLAYTWYEDELVCAEPAGVVLQGAASLRVPAAPAREVPEGGSSALAMRQPFPANAPAGGDGEAPRGSLVGIAEAYRLNLVADGYRCRPLEERPMPGDREPTLREALEQYVAPNAGWTLEGGFLRVRRHLWYYDDRRDVPDELVRQWAEYLRGRSILTLDETAALVRDVREEQWPEMVNRLREQGVRLEGLSDVTAHQEVLRVYAALSPAQREFLRAGGWLSSQALLIGAQRWVEPALREWQRRAWVAGGAPPARAVVFTLAEAEPLPPTQAVLEVMFRAFHQGTPAEYRIRLPYVNNQPREQASQPPASPLP